MRHMLEPFISGPQTSPYSVRRINEWLTENRLNPANIPAPGAYVVRDVLGGGWVLVARRYVHDVHGHRIPVKAWPGHYQKTIQISTPVTTPPDFVTAEGDPR